MKLSKAQLIANTVREILKPHSCAIDIAGSVRRQKADVNDIEIVCVLPKRTPAGMALIKAGAVVQKGTFGGRYCRILWPDGMIFIDIFMPQPTDYYRIFAIRTGSADYSAQVIAAAWSKKGWCGTEDGLRLKSECAKTGPSKWVLTATNPMLPPVWESELDFFNWLGVPYVEPEYREIR